MCLNFFRITFPTIHVFSKLFLIYLWYLYLKGSKMHGYSPGSNLQKFYATSRLCPVVPFCWWGNWDIEWKFRLSIPPLSISFQRCQYHLWKIWKVFLLKVSADCFTVQISWFCYHHLFFYRYTEEVCYTVNYMMSKCIPLLGKIYFICNLHPHTFHTNDTHPHVNNTFHQGSSMTLIFEICLERWKRTKVMKACNSLYKSTEFQR